MAGIFVSYRREDAAGWALSIRDHLASTLGGDQVFMDIDNIAPGDDFVDAITSTLDRCDVLVAVIGPRWLAVVDPAGRPRIEAPDDFVATEIASALERDVRVIPALVDGVAMPSVAELPERLAALSRRQAVHVSAATFRQDMAHLTDALRQATKANRPVEPADRAPATAARGAPPVPGRPEVPAPGHAREVLVRGITCSRGHLNDPRQGYCQYCGISFIAQSTELDEGPRPSLGRIVLDDGQSFELDADHVIGREPELAGPVTAALARPVRMEDPERAISRVHAAIELHDWDIRVRYLGSANATCIAAPSDTEWTPVPEGGTVVTPGTYVLIGHRTLQILGPDMGSG